MATLIKSTDLDFDTIKNQLKTKLKEQTEFSDYDFEASGLSNILDVLAYNTHFNGLTANFALNESFLTTAQLRSSIVAHAESIGYVPTSYSSSQAKLDLSITVPTTPRPTTVTLPRNSQFTTSVNDVSFTFQTRENFTATDDGNGTYQFTTTNGETAIPVFEGTERTKTFFVGEKNDVQIYVIPDVTIDTSTIRVRVFDTATGTTFTTYTDISKAVRITNNSTLYQIKEVPNGYYELIFGDGLSSGKAPIAGNKIIVDYLSTQGPSANDASIFTTDVALTVNSTQYDLTAVTNSSSSGGAFKEGLESIRRNAPLAFGSQRRLVTAEDYTGQILSTYGSFLDDAIAWGGHDNEPQVYGRVYVGLKFKDNIDIDTQQTVKDTINTDLTSNMSIMSITTEFVDPVTTNLELTTFFNLDPDLTSSTQRAVENLVQTTINSHFSTTLNKFNKVFRRSSLLTQIDDLDIAILNSRIDVKVQQEFVPSLSVQRTYTINFPTTLAANDDVNHTITTSNFTFNSKTCTIKNLLKSNKLQIISQDNTVEADNIGSYNEATGTVSLTGFNPTSIDGTAIKISATPANQSTIRPLRNFIISIDTSKSSSTAVLDFQNTKVNL